MLPLMVCPVARGNAQVRVINSAFFKDIGANCITGHASTAVCIGTAIYEPGVCHLGERCIANVWEISLLKFRRSGHVCCSLSSEGGVGVK